MKYEKNIEMENYLSKSSLQILFRTFFDKMYILCFDLKKKKSFVNQEFYFLTKTCEIQNKRWNAKSFA